MWTRSEFGFNSLNETLNFGTRILAEGDALYETATLAVITADVCENDKNPSIQCISQDNKVYLAVDTTFRIFSENCTKNELFTTVDSKIDYFCVSLDSKLVLLCLHDGDIHCLHVPSGGKVVCSALVSDDSNNSVLSVFTIDEDPDNISFLIYTKHGHFYRLYIKNINKIYESIMNDEDVFEVDFTFELIKNVKHNHSIVNTSYENHNFYSSHKYKRYFADCGPLILALTEDKSLIGVCKLTNTIFDLWNTEELNDLIFLKSFDSNEDRLLVVSTKTDENNEEISNIKLLSYPDFDIIYNLKVSKHTYLVNLNTEQDEVMFIEGICAANSDVIKELRLKVINESVPEVKLQRILRKKCYEEALNFATTYGLSAQPIYMAQAEDFIINSNFLISNTKAFCAILDRIDDINFIVQYCLEIPADSLNGIEFLLEYANQKLHIEIQNNPDDNDDDEKYFSLRKRILETLYRLETFRILHSENYLLDSSKLIELWSHFSTVDLLEETQKYLKNGKIDKSTLLFTRLKQEIDLSSRVVKNILKMIPPQITLMEQLPFLRNIFLTCLDSKPELLPILIDWVYKSILRCETQYKSEWAEYVLNFAQSILSFLRQSETKVYSQQHTINDVSIQKFKNLIISLQEIIDLKREFGISITFSEYIQEPRLVINFLLNKIRQNQISDFVDEFLVKYVHKHKLNLDEILCEFIEEVTNSQTWWESIVIPLLDFISANTNKFQIILMVLRNADVPWTVQMKQLAENAINESHPLSDKIQILEENIAVKLLLKKYSIDGISNFEDEDVTFIMRIILQAAKPEMLEDLETISSRNPHLREQCSILCLNHFIQNGQTDEALKFLDNLNENALVRCIKSVLYTIQHFLFSKIKCVELLNSYFEILNSMIQRLENLPKFQLDVYQNEIGKLKNIYKLKVKFNCTKILNPNFELSQLLPNMVTDIITSLSENKIDWFEATNKCESLSYLIGVSKEDCFFELVKQSGNLNGLIHAAENMLKCDSNTLAMCSMVILIMKNIDMCELGQNDTLKTRSEHTDNKNKKSLLVINALRLAYQLTLRACVKANRLELPTACELLNWCNICYWLRNEPVPWRFTPLFHPENMCSYSIRTVTIWKELFNIFLNLSDERILVPKTIKQNGMGQFDYDSLPKKLQQLQIEGYDLTTYQLLITFKHGLNIIKPESELYQMKNIIKLSISRSITQILHKILVSKKIDQTLAFSLFLTSEYQPLKWLPAAIKKFKTDVKKLHSIASLGCAYLQTININAVEYIAYDCLRYRCDWWNKFLNHCVSYSDTFLLEPDEILKKYLLLSDKLNLTILNEFCTDFKLNIQQFLPLYLRNTLLHWKPKTKIVQLQGSQKTLIILNSENELLKKCKEIISFMQSKNVAIQQLNSTWKEVSYYQYEVYICIIDLLEYLDETSQNTNERVLLSFLKTYARISDLQQKEREDWQTKFPFTREIDPFSKYRLPFFLAMLTGDIWEIIRPEINLNSYKNWFKAASSIKLEQDNICTYAIKGTIHSGILNSNDTKWSVHSKHNSLLENMDLCASQIKNLEVATAVLYQAVCSMSGGADQVIIAKMCWKKAKQWKNSMPSSEHMDDVWLKVKRKYLNTLSAHILFSNNLGERKYLDLVGNTEELIKELYNDESIVNRAKGIVMFQPDINHTVDELAQNLNVDIAKIRTTLIMEYLQGPCGNIDCDETYYNPSVIIDDATTTKDKLLRVIYICESSDDELLKNLLLNVSFSTLDDTISISVTTSNLSVRCKALQCFLAVCSENELRILTGQTNEELSAFLEKLQILCTLESTGYVLTPEELDICNKNDLAWKILHTHSYNQSVLQTIAKLCSQYEIWDTSLWDKLLYYFVEFKMVSDLQEWLPKLYSCCYTPGINCNFITGWECVIKHNFFNATENDFIHGFLMIQNCPIISKLDACLMNIFDLYHSKNQLEFCAMLLPYTHNENSQTKILKVIQPFKGEEFYAKIRSFATQGLLNTNCVVNMLINYN